jgi:rhamnose utilization protein RhaD (predicted bifunctional aldolase and dehydrogenase)
VSRERILQQLVELSRHLGDPALDYAILGEGNSSAAVDAETFYVKASGLCLRDIDAGGFVRVRRDAILALLDRERVTDDEIREGMMAARAAPISERRPSVETLFHAYLLGLEGVEFVGHTHPTPVNAILCSREGEAAVRGRIFPDEIVCCGVAPVWVPYTDPGQPLAREIRQGVEAHLDRHGVAPRIVLMQNHGLIALGRTPQEVGSATAMFVKTARILLGTAAFGGPNFLTEENVRRIYTRPDEKYREQGIVGRATEPAPGSQGV